MADSFLCDYLRVSTLVQLHPQKKIRIVNLYAQIYDLGWFYSRGEERNALTGPMGEYHNQITYDSWVHCDSQK